MADEEPLESELCINLEVNVKTKILKPRQKENILNELKNDLNSWNNSLDNNKVINDEDYSTHAIKILRKLYQKQIITKVDLKNVSREEPSLFCERVCAAGQRKSRKDDQNTPTKSPKGSPPRRSKSVPRTPPRNKWKSPENEKEHLNVEEQRNINRKSPIPLKHKLDLWKHTIHALLDETKTEIEHNSIINLAIDILKFLFTKEYITHADLNKVSIKEPASSASTGKQKSRKDKQNHALPDESPTKFPSSESPERGSLSTKVRKIYEETERPFQKHYHLKKRLNFERDDEPFCDCAQNKKNAELEYIRQQQELKELTSKINQLESDKQYYFSEAVRLQKEKETFEQNIRQKSNVNQLVVLHDQNEKLKEQVRTLVGDMEYLTERLNIANRDNKQLTVERDIHKNTVEQQKTLIQEIKKSQTHESCMQAEQHYREEIDRANHKVQSLTSKVRELSHRLDKQHTAIEQSERTIKDMNDLLAHVDDRRHSEVISYSYEEQLYKTNEELVKVRKKLQSMEEQQQYIGNKRLSDIEKENISLKTNLNMALRHLEESRKENTAFEKRYRNTISTMEMERNKLQDRINKLSFKLQNMKSHDEQEKNSIKHELRRMKEHNDQLDNDKHILEKELQSLKDQKRELQNSMQQAEANVQNQRNLKEENESLKKALTTANMDLKDCKERCKKETELRIGFTELRNENDKLQNERNAALSELEKRTAERNELTRKLVTETDAAKAEHEQQLKKERNDLINLFKEKSNRDKEKISKLEHEYETFDSRFRHSKEMRVPNDDAYNNKLINENDRLRSERNLARTELLKVTKEKDDMSHELKEMVIAAKFKNDTLKREKDDLMLEFKEKSERDDKKLRNLQEEYDNLRARYTETDTQFHKDDAYNKLCEENNILRSERIELKLAKAKDEKLQEVAKSENDKLKKEIDNLMADFEEQSKREKDKIINLRQECGNIFAKYEKNLKTLSHKDEENDRLRTELLQIKEEKEDILHKLKQQVTAAKVEQEKCYILEREIENLNLRYKKEKDTTSHKDDTYNELREENNRLRNERDSGIAKVTQITKEKEEMSHKLKKEVTAAKLEIAELKKDKDNLMTDCKEESNRDKQTISKLHQECEDLRAKYSSEAKMLQHNAYELMQLRNDITICKNEKAQLEEALKNQNQDNMELENKLRDLESKGLRCPQCDEYERTMAKMKKEKQELQDNYNIASTNTNNAKKKIQELLDTIEERYAEKHNLESILSKSERDLENQKRFYQSLQGEHTLLTRRIENLLSENADLKEKCKLKDDLLQKADKENRQLKVDIDQLKSNMVGHHQEIETLNTRIEILREEKLELESRTRSKSPQVTSEPKQCQNCWKYKNDISELKKEVNSLRDRLSEAAGNKLRDNNPNIADLSDMNRPTSLAEKFSSLYTDEYTDAMEVIENNMSEEECAGTMLQWLKSCYDWCERLATEQRDMLTQRSIGFMQDHLGKGENFIISARCLIHVKEFQKKIAVDSLIAVAKICHIKSLKEENPLNDNHITKYIKKCSELCWMMQITDPPLCLKFDVKRGESLDRNSYNVFTKGGSKVDFLVWPILYLHKTGPLLAKGVAQGM